MHIDDAHDDNLVAEETAFHAHTRAQTRAADAAKALDEPIILTTSSDDKTIDQIAPPSRAFATTTDKIAPPLPHTKIALQPPRAFVSITSKLPFLTNLPITMNLPLPKLSYDTRLNLYYLPTTDQM